MIACGLKNRISQRPFLDPKATINLISHSVRQFAMGFGLSYDKKQDFYQILGVPPRSTEQDIKKAYYKLAQKYHPDKAGADNKAFEEKFKQVSGAYEILKNKEQRDMYDMLREAAHNPSAAKSQQ